MRDRRRCQRAAALVEFALVWPIALLVVLAGVETAVWSAESYAARAAALAGARAGSVAGGTPAAASAVALRTLAASLVGVAPRPWCAGTSLRAPEVWVCARDLGTAIEVDVGGSVPALVPVGPNAGIPIHGHAVLDKERFST